MDHAAEDESRERSNAVDDDHRGSEQRGFDRRRAAGDNGAIGRGERVVCFAFDSFHDHAGPSALGGREDR